MPPRRRMMAMGSGSPHLRHTVLVVDDNQDSRDALALLLECLGFGVATAANGLEALHLMLTLGMRPCVVLVDLIMPVMDGFDLHKRSERSRSKPGNIDELLAFIGDHCPASATSGPKRQRA